MTGIVVSELTHESVAASRRAELTELVRGSDHGLIEEFEPLVRRQSVCLNLAAVERIDAAGIAALISLYRIAQESGHDFTISAASARVEEMLALVGLDQLLLSYRSEPVLLPCGRRAQNAA